MSDFSNYSKSTYNSFNLSDDEIKANYFASEKQIDGGNGFGHYTFSPRTTQDAIDALDGKFQINCVVQIANKYYAVRRAHKTN